MHKIDFPFRVGEYVLHALRATSDIPIAPGAHALVAVPGAEALEIEHEIVKIEALHFDRKKFSVAPFASDLAILDGAPLSVINVSTMSEKFHARVVVRTRVR